MPNENLTNAELTRLEASKSEDDWNQACAAVKQARGGVYPSDWFARVIQAGIAKRVVESFGGSADIQLMTINKDGTTVPMRTPVPALARRVCEIAAKLPPEDRLVLNELWARLEVGETDAAYWEARYKGTWPGSSRMCWHRLLDDDF